MTLVSDFQSYENKSYWCVRADWGLTGIFMTFLKERIIWLECVAPFCQLCSQRFPEWLTVSSLCRPLEVHKAPYCMCLPQSEDISQMRESLATQKLCITLIEKVL